MKIDLSSSSLVVRTRHWCSTVNTPFPTYDSLIDQWSIKQVWQANKDVSPFLCCFVVVVAVVVVVMVVAVAVDWMHMNIV